MLSSSQRQFPRLLAAAWVVLLLVPGGWWHGQVGDWNFTAGLYSSRRYQVGHREQNTELLAYAGGGLCDSGPGADAPLCLGRTDVARSSLLLQLAGASCAGLLVAATILADVPQLSKGRFYGVVSLLYAAPVLAIAGIMQFTYMAMHLEGDWLNLGPAFLCALFLAPLSTLPLFFAPSIPSRRRTATDPEAPSERTVRFGEGAREKGAPTCPGEHALRAFISQDGNFECDLCDIRQPMGVCILGCRICNFDICVRCKTPGMQMETTINKAKVSFGPPQISEYTINRETSGSAPMTDQGEVSGSELSGSSFDDGAEDSSEEEVEEMKLHSSSQAPGLMGLVGELFTGPKPLLEGFMWKMNSDVEVARGSEGHDTALEDIGNWRRRWFSIVGEGQGQGLTMSYLSEKSNGEIAKVTTVGGMKEVCTRFEVLPVVTIHRVYDQKEYDAIFRMKAYDTAFEHRIPILGDDGPQIPSQLFPILLAWTEGMHMSEAGDSQSARARRPSVISGSHVVLSEKVFVVACESEEQRRVLLRGCQRMFHSLKPKQHGRLRTGSRRKSTGTAASGSTPASSRSASRKAERLGHSAPVRAEEP